VWDASVATREERVRYVGEVQARRGSFGPWEEERDHVTISATRLHSDSKARGFEDDGVSGPGGATYKRASMACTLFGGETSLVCRAGKEVRSESCGGVVRLLSAGGATWVTVRLTLMYKHSYIVAQVSPGSSDRLRASDLSLS
jgi:hypothetical protein